MLFVVKDTYQVPQKGLLLSADSRFKPKEVELQSELKLVLPNGNVLYTSVIGIGWDTSAIIVSQLSKEEVPIGTEVWLLESK